MLASSCANLMRRFASSGLLMLSILYLGYAWLPLGLLLVALSKMPVWFLSTSAAWHALTAGAMACSIHAVASRAVARRADQLRPALIDLASFAFLWVAAFLRVFSPIDAIGHTAAPLIWCIAWAIFLLRHGAALFTPRPRPVFSGSKRVSGCQNERARLAVPNFSGPTGGK